MPIKFEGVHKFTVEGRGRFPIDMLRFDRCWPRDTDATANIDWAMYPELDAKRNIGPYRVTLLHNDERRHWEPTAARWSSFGWSVVSHEVIE